MVRIPQGNSQSFGLQPVLLDDFLIDRCEVTNRQFKEFVDQGGYQTGLIGANSLSKTAACSPGNKPWRSFATPPDARDQRPGKWATIL
ncbi:MAG: SUMF1/EgtB/PvdO family nonheme iron enzyme [Bryobacteraceae bacterium]